MTEIIDSLKAALGDQLVDCILGSKILVVGAGGIGSELLKNLALTGTCGFSFVFYSVRED